MPKGFGLIELVLALTIASLLTAISIPFYLNQVNGSREVEPRERMRRLLSEQKTYYTEHGVFATAWGELTELLQESTSYSYQLFDIEQGAGIIINTKHKDLHSYLGGVKVAEKKHILVFSSKQCISNKPGIILEISNLEIKENHLKCGKKVREVNK